MFIYGVQKSTFSPENSMLILCDKEEKYYMLIIMNSTDVQIIQDQLKYPKSSRPTCFDLFAKILGHYSVSLKQMLITHMNEAVFHSQLLFSSKEGLDAFHCRTSEAIAIAQQAMIPILVTEDLIKEVAVMKQQLKLTNTQPIERKPHSNQNNPFDEIDNEELEHMLAEALNDEDYDVRKTAVEGIITLAQASPELPKDAMPYLM